MWPSRRLKRLDSLHYTLLILLILMSCLGLWAAWKCSAAYEMNGRLFNQSFSILTNSVFHGKAP